MSITMSVTNNYKPEAHCPNVHLTNTAIAYIENQASVLSLQPITISHLNKICMVGRGLLVSIFVNLFFPNILIEIEKLLISLSHYKSMETVSCHSNQSSYPTGTKTQFM